MGTVSKKARKEATDPQQALTALLYQLLETEMGGVQVYRTALQCVVHPELQHEWSKYLAETERHVVIARQLVVDAGLDPDAEIPARIVCRHVGDSLVHTMLEALATGTPEQAQLVAAECVIHAETKDHMNWELLALYTRKQSGPLVDAMRAACEEVEVQEDHHLYHTQGWARELWAQSLGLPSVLPPPEEVLQVESAAGAARAKKTRDKAPRTPT